AFQCQRQRHANRAAANNDKVVVVMMGHRISVCFKSDLYFKEQLIFQLTTPNLLFLTYYFLLSFLSFVSCSSGFLTAFTSSAFAVRSSTISASSMTRYSPSDVPVDWGILRRSHHNRKPRAAAATTNNARNAVKKKTPRTAMIINA